MDYPLDSNAELLTGGGLNSERKRGGRRIDMGTAHIIILTVVIQAENKQRPVARVWTMLRKALPALGA